MKDTQEDQDAMSIMRAKHGMRRLSVNGAGQRLGVVGKLI